MPVVINGTTGITNVNGSAAAPAETGIDTDTGIYYGTNTVGLATNGTSALFIDTSQNVGIGTSSPGYRLDTRTSGDAALNVQSTGTIQSAYVRIVGRQTSVDEEWNVVSTGAGLGSPALRFVRGTWTGTPSMLIDSSGNLLVGTTTSNGKLTSDAGTAGSALVARGGNINAQGGQIAMINTYAGVPGPNKSMRIANNGNWQIINSAYSAAIIEITDAGVAYQGNNSSTWSVISDIRIKTNVRQIGGALDKMMALKPCHFEYKNAIGEVSTGFIAQEFEQVFPGHVKEQSAPMQFEQFIDGDDKTIKTVDANLVPYLVKAIQELKTQNDELRARVAALEGK